MYPSWRVHIDVQLSALCPLLTLSHGMRVFIEHACTAALTAVSVHPENLHTTIFITYSHENVRSHVLLNAKMITNYKHSVFLADSLSLLLSHLHSLPFPFSCTLRIHCASWCCDMVLVLQVYGSCKILCVRFTHHAALPFPSWPPFSFRD